VNVGATLGPRLAAVGLIAGCADARPIVASPGPHDCSAPGISVHECGILDVDSPSFHGNLVRELNWNLQTCALCHGQDFSGGAAQSSCLTCHPGPGGPTGCTTCHGQPPQTGAHLAHASGESSRPLDCTECHLKPSLYTDVGHLFDPNHDPLPTPAVVTLGAFAATTNDQGVRNGPPSFDESTDTCRNVYCHGSTLADANAKENAPSWNGGAASGGCGTCHGLPPSNHSHFGSKRCDVCHPEPHSLTASVDPKTHVDGKVQVGNGSGDCSACHGSPGQPAPPRDLLGNTDESAIGVGAHVAHLTAAHDISAPIACIECHAVPAQLNDPGHIDHDLPATVFPASILTGSLAGSDRARPAWDHASGTCANVYCHGGGELLALNDRAPGVNRTPVWTSGSSQAACGSCHGIPPDDGIHIAGTPLTQCVKCHANTMDATGAIVVSGPPGARVSAHINGVVDVTK